MRKYVDLPIIEPMYSTYHYQGPCTAIIETNPSIKNWCLNQTMILKCTRKFLSGFTTPEVSVVQSSWYQNPHFERIFFSSRYLEGYCHPVINKMLEQGYYICFEGIDDYYIEGKTWYNTRHFVHDGCICGYDPKSKKYCLYAYDSNWVYRKFWTPKKSFEASRKHLHKRGIHTSFYAIKPKLEKVELDPNAVITNLSTYLDSNMKKYPPSQEGEAHGTVVHDYIALYIDKLFNDSIPHERTDKRVFRMVWEHKKVMLERLIAMETTLGLDNKTSQAYQKIVDEANNIRMIYMAYCLRCKKSVLPIIKNKLLYIKNREKVLLKNFIKKAKKKNPIT